MDWREWMFKAMLLGLVTSGIGYVGGLVEITLFDRSGALGISVALAGFALTMFGTIGAFWSDEP